MNDEIKAQEKKDANTCMALGAGVGALGIAGAAIAGAVCPLCYFVAPGLIGVGAFKRWRSGRDTPQITAEESNSKEQG